MSGRAVRRRVIVGGHVQGVFFRDSVRRAADAAGVAGWIRNRPDGSVEAVFEGDSRAVGELVALCRRGPPEATVDAVECIDEHVRGESGFEIR